MIVARFSAPGGPGRRPPSPSPLPGHLLHRDDQGCRPDLPVVRGGCSLLVAAFGKAVPFQPPRAPFPLLAAGDCLKIFDLGHDRLREAP